MADDEEQNTSSKAHVRFGKKFFIDPSTRLEQFDNGTAKAYEAYDERAKTKKYIALVCNKSDFPRWTSTSIYDSLADTSFMRLEGAQSVYWTPERREKFVVLYVGGVGEPLVPEGGHSSTQWRHPDIVQYLIQPMARMLHEMSDKAFSHGAIRPSNIFHGSLNKDKPVILGDCLSVQPNSTQSAAFLTIEKALADPMGRGGGSLTDDIYAFGVSLLFFLRKGDAISGLSDEEIVKKKVELGSYAALVGTERFQATFLEFLRGVLHDDPELRWGLEEINSWLDGSRLTPPPFVKRKKASRPLVLGGIKYLYADSLALDLHKSPTEVANIVSNGTLARWVNKSLDDINLQDRYERVIERVANVGDVHEHKDYLVSQLRMAFNPQLPLRYKDKTFRFDGLGGLLAQALVEQKNTDFFKDILMLNLPDHGMGNAELNQADIVTNLKVFDTCRNSLRQKKLGYGIERCYYAMLKDAVCLSDVFDRYFVTGHKSALTAFEEMCKNKKLKSASLIDQHMAAMFLVINYSAMERSIFDLASEDEDKQVIGNLRFFAFMQMQANKMMTPHLGKLFFDALGGAVKVFKNKETQKEVVAKLSSASKDGNLIEMSQLLNDERHIAVDNRAFALAAQEFKYLQNEYNEYNRRLSYKETYGIENGHDAAVIVSWCMATVINLIVVFAYFSGYKIF